MIQLDSKILSDNEQTTLYDLQEKVNQETTFNDKVEKAQKLWSSKGNANGKRAFEKIRDTLLEMCVYEGICNYCEQNEANDIEHIHPKSFFPEYTFVWDNYILACKQCNSAYKLDKCLVLDANGDLVSVVRKTEPPFKTHAFINPRIENPNDYMILETKTFQFVQLPGLSKNKSNRAKATLEILSLNERDTLLQARKSSYRHFYDLLTRIVNIRNSKNEAELRLHLYPGESYIDFTKSLDELKTEFTNSFKKHIQSYQHPSVWHSIKLIESKTDEKWRSLFQKLPEALNW